MAAIVLMAQPPGQWSVATGKNVLWRTTHPEGGQTDRHQQEYLFFHDDRHGVGHQCQYQSVGRKIAAFDL